MKLATSSVLAAVAVLLTATSCYYTEDPGPIQETQEVIDVTDFDRVGLGDAFDITIEQSDVFEVVVRGDRRNIDDLIVTKVGSTLVMRYEDNHNRRHTTLVTIRMPQLVGAHLGGASKSTITGFHDLTDLEIHLSGASICELDAQSDKLDLVVSCASYINMVGTGSVLNADLSGASRMRAFNFPVTSADLSLSGASSADVDVAERLDAVASGGSQVHYRGNPQVFASVSGASSVLPD